jgi:hypothetical protein
LKSALKRVAFARTANARLKCWQTKRRYEALCAEYGTPSILSDRAAIAKLTRSRWLANETPSGDGAKRRVLFVGTDYEQDRSGTLQALRSACDLHLFEHAPGQYGQRWPVRVAEFDEVRRHNARVLRETVARLGSVDAIVGQMWGLSMHWEVLAEMRDRGIAVVNISMDDRHAFAGTCLPDGTDGGTRGIAPYLSLALTDAAECVSWYEALGTRSLFFPEASDPNLFAPAADAKRYDVAFVGASYGIRGRLVDALQRAGVAVQAYGNGWPNGRIATEEVPALFARSRIVLGCGTVGHCDDFVALKLRDFDGPMSGSLYVTNDNPDFDPLFDGNEIATFTDIAGAVDRVRYFLAHEDERERIAAAGRARCLRDHTWAHRVRMLLHSI